MCARATLVDIVGPRTRVEVRVDKPIRMGVIGLGQRSYNVLAGCIEYDEYELVAVCDLRKELIERAKRFAKEKGVSVRGYEDFEEMIDKEELDAVAVVVDPDKQIPIACKAMEKGVHVMVEVPLAYTLKDCWDVVTTVERTGRVFLLMEQVRYSGVVRAWKEIVDSGLIGKPIFCEGEYFHHQYKLVDQYFQDDNGRFYTPEQAAKNPAAKPAWRQLVDAPYLPHDLSPLLYILDDRVDRVVGMGTRKGSYRYPNLDVRDITVGLMHTEKDVILRLADGHTSSGIMRGESGGHWLHIKGTEGELEWKRNSGGKCLFWSSKLKLDQPIEVDWTKKRPDVPESLSTGHGGLDYFPFACFADAVLRGEKLEFDVYKAADITAPAILTIKSIKEGSMPQVVPDFRPNDKRKAGEFPEKIGE